MQRLLTSTREGAQRTKLGWLKKFKWRRLIKRVILYAFILSLSLLFALPLLWAISTSLKSEPQIMVAPPEWIPNPVLWRNYPEALTYVPFFRYIINTLIVAIPSVIGTLISCTVVAYGFSRIRWKFRNVFFFICICTMMLPLQVRMIPLFITFKHLGWLNTYLPLIVPSFFGSAYYIFLLRQFFMTIPVELSDAARIDGCLEAGILFRIILPLCKPVLAVVALFRLMLSWNNYMGPLIYLRDDKLWTVALGLTRYQTAYAGRSTWAYLMVGSVIATVPILVIFFLAQRTFIEGITLQGIKS